MFLKVALFVCMCIGWTYTLCICIVNNCDSLIGHVSCVICNFTTGIMYCSHIVLCCFGLCYFVNKIIVYKCLFYVYCLQEGFENWIYMSFYRLQAYPWVDTCSAI